MKYDTHIVMVVDRSGSMQSVQQDAEGAINTFLTEQKGVPGDCYLTLVQFDARGFGGGDEDWYETFYDGPLTEATTYTLQPRGGTALRDAVGTAIDTLGARFAAMPEGERPGQVIVVVQTDGGENSSRTYHGEKVKGMIEHQTEVYGWSFIYLGMGADTWGQGVSLGFGNNVRASGSGASYGDTYALTTQAVAQSRISGKPIVGIDQDVQS